MVVMLDAFEPLQVHNTKRSQRQADPKQYQTHIEPPAAKQLKKMTYYFKSMKNYCTN